MRNVGWYLIFLQVIKRFYVSATFRLFLLQIPTLPINPAHNKPCLFSVTNLYNVLQRHTITYPTDLKYNIIHSQTCRLSSP